jgi:hypothetical protein
VQKIAMLFKHLYDSVKLLTTGTYCNSENAYLKSFT